ncbi:VOC family protein [Phenylobacterium aquaticum]|uniref:VOC family protein n=1 Tax=Phenylobacterium aquaticum TaxID=1763816 RepID=UPI0026E9D6A5|nr:VOC family protein [Phenylobacterium aquaticum]
MKPITPCLWFDNQVEEAVTFYVALFPNSKVGEMFRYGDHGPGPAGQVVTAQFELNGTRFTALNGGPMFQFAEAVSFVIQCADQAEIDRYWTALSEGGAESQCGWLKDRFGLSWQVLPENMSDLIGGPDPAKAGRAVQAMLKMRKIDIAALEAARAG